MRRRRVKLSFFILIGAVALIVALVLIILSRRGGEITSGSMMLEEKITPVIVRDEKIFMEETYGNVIFFASEGESVTPETKVAEVFKYGYQTTIMQDYRNQQAEIKNYQVNSLLSGIETPELDLYDAQVKQKTNQLVAVQQGKDPADLLQVQRELQTVLDERREYLITTVQADETLLRMYENEQHHKDRIDTWKRDVKSQGQGIVSFYFDGYESVVNRDNLGDISPGIVGNILKGAGKASFNDINEKPFYRIIDNSRWYCALAQEKNDDLHLVRGETYTVVFDGYFDRPYDATVVGENITSSSSRVYILEINDDIGPFIGVRATKATISKSIQGLKVPSRLIATIDGNKKGVYVGANDGKRLVEVEILGVDGSETFIAATSEGEVLQAGMRVSPK